MNYVLLAGNMKIKKRGNDYEEDYGHIKREMQHNERGKHVCYGDGCLYSHSDLYVGAPSAGGS